MDKLREAARQALGALVRAEALYGQPNADIQTAIREALAIISEAGGTPAGIIIALDRQERVREDAAESAAQAVAAEHAIPVVAVASLSDLLAFAGESATLAAHREALLAYRARYGVV